MTVPDRSSVEASDSTCQKRLLRLPSFSLLRVFLWEAFLVTGLWLLVYTGADWICSLHSIRIPIRTKLDSAIPFIPAAAALYLSLFPMIWLAPFVLHSARELCSFSHALAIVILIAGIGFVLVPVEPIEVQCAETGVFARLFQLADGINLKYNCFPSLHVAMAVVCATAFSREKLPAVTTGFWLWAAAISLSTLLTGQHYVSDAIAGGLLVIFIARQQVVHRLTAKQSNTSYGQY